MKKPKKSSAETGPKTIPAQVQLPGNVVLKSMPFKIVAYNDDGTPRLFELQPEGPHDMRPAYACVLFANEKWIRSPIHGKPLPPLPPTPVKPEAPAS